MCEMDEAVTSIAGQMRGAQGASPANLKRGEDLEIHPHQITKCEHQTARLRLPFTSAPSNDRQIYAAQPTQWYALPLPLAVLKCSRLTSLQSSESRLYTFSQETKDHLRKFRLGTSRSNDPQAVICMSVSLHYTKLSLLRVMDPSALPRLRV